MIKMYSSQSITPVSNIMMVMNSRKKKEDNNKKNKGSKNSEFSNILTEEIDKTQKVLRR